MLRPPLLSCMGLNDVNACTYLLQSMPMSSLDVDAVDGVAAAATGEFTDSNFLCDMANKDSTLVAKFKSTSFGVASAWRDNLLNVSQTQFPITNV